VYTYKVVIKGRIVIYMILHRYICDLYSCHYLINYNYALLSFLTVLLLHDLEDHRTSVINWNKQKLLC